VCGLRIVEAKNSRTRVAARAGGGYQGGQPEPVDAGRHTTLTNRGNAAAHGRYPYWVRKVRVVVIFVPS
jgi:hypothetical protein